jgi:hypothetical protein
MTSLLCTGRSHLIHGQRSTGVAGLVRAYTYHGVKVPRWRCISILSTNE